MTDIVRSLDVSNTLEEVWAVLGDFGSISAWAPNVDHSCLMTEECSGIGAVRRIQTGRTTVLERVVAWDPPATLSYSIEGLPPVVRSVTNTWHVYRVADGTRIGVTSQIDAGPRPPQKIVAKVIARKLAEASDVMLAGLASVLAASAEAAAVRGAVT